MTVSLATSGCSWRDARHDGAPRSRRRGGLVLRAGRAALGHRRLSIVDVSPAGHQPMSNEDGSVWVDLQRRDLQPRRAAPGARGARAHRTARTATPRRSSTSMRRRASAASSGSTACSRWRSGTSAGASCSLRVIAWARSRCTGPGPRRASPSPLRSRRCCAIRRSAPTSTSRPSTTTSLSCARPRRRPCLRASASSRPPSG